jgi:hypothetical protein
MRFVDLAVAGIIGAATVGALIYWSPGPFLDSSHRSRAEGAMLDRLAGLVDSRGLAWFLDSDLSSICGFFASVSNSTILYSADVGGEQCPGTPSSGSASVTLVLPLPSKEVILEGWLAGTG